MSRGFFITGTDTDVGKTSIALGLMYALQQQGMRVAAMKPVSAGCELTAEGLRNEDARLLLQQSSMPLPYERVNPYAFEPAIAPHIAAAESGIEMQLAPLVEAYKSIAAQADVVIVEGAGGWLVPLNERQTLADFAGELHLPVIIIVGMRLGCLNHALLTEQAIKARGLKPAGWVANQLCAVMPYFEDNLAYLQSHLEAPLLGIVPHQQQTREAIAGCLNLNAIL